MLEKSLEARTTELNKLEKESQSARHDFYLKINQISNKNNSLKEKCTKIVEGHKAVTRNLVFQHLAKV
jgi:predicted  nucleic acid-binding Zn-ribbon protein